MLESNQCVTGLEYWRMAKGQREIHQTCPAHCLSGPGCSKHLVQNFKGVKIGSRVQQEDLPIRSLGPEISQVFVHFIALILRVLCAPNRALVL